MDSVDAVLSRQIGQRAGDAKNGVIAARRQLHLLGSLR
jgi:hypothetical protein